MSIYPADFITTTCTIIDKFAPLAYHARLQNGKQLVAFLQKKEAYLLDVLKEGVCVRVTINPADFERARIRSLVEERKS